MAGRKQSKSGQHQAGLPIEDYRHEGATRPNNPPAAIAAEGRTPPAPRTSYAYSPRLDPALRSDPSGQADGHDSAAGSCAWYVVGLEMSVREWAMRQGWGGRPVPPPQAQGMLVATLSVLAGHFGLVGRQRAA